MSTCFRFYPDLSDKELVKITDKMIFGLSLIILLSPFFLVQKLIGKMQFSGMFSANCGQDCGIPRGIVKHSFGNQIYIQCKLPLVAQHSFNRISKNIEERENQNIFKEFFCCRKCTSQSFWFYFITKCWSNKIELPLTHK